MKHMKKGPSTVPRCTTGNTMATTGWSIRACTRSRRRWRPCLPPCRKRPTEDCEPGAVSPLPITCLMSGDYENGTDSLDRSTPPRSDKGFVIRSNRSHRRRSSIITPARLAHRCPCQMDKGTQLSGPPRACQQAPSCLAHLERGSLEASPGVSPETNLIFTTACLSRTSGDIPPNACEISKRA